MSQLCHHLDHQHFTGIPFYVQDRSSSRSFFLQLSAELCSLRQCHLIHHVQQLGSTICPVRASQFRSTSPSPPFQTNSSFGLCHGAFSRWNAPHACEDTPHLAIRSHGRSRRCSGAWSHRPPPGAELQLHSSPPNAAGHGGSDAIPRVNAPGEHTEMQLCPETYMRRYVQVTSVFISFIAIWCAVMKIFIKGSLGI